MLRWKRAIAVTSVLAAVGLSAGASPGGAAPDVAGTGVTMEVPNAGLVTVERDSVGVPHVTASSYRALAYGLGDAFAADNICAMEQLALTVEGDRSRWLGAQTAPPPDLLEPFGTNLDSDLYHRLVNQTGEVERLLEQPAPIGPSQDARHLVSGYVQGFNRYLSDHTAAGITDPSCRAAEWVRPLTDLDIWRYVFQFGQQASAPFAQGFRAAVPPGQASAEAAGPASGGDALTRFRHARQHAAAGSNALAIGRDASASGKGMLLANPHFPWIGNGRFYRMTLTVPGRMNVSGASPFGVPVVGIGYNSALAWTHTVTSAVPLVVEKLILAPGDPTSYVKDGVRHRMTVERVSVPTSAADGGKAVVHDFYRSDQGPIVVLDQQHGWSTTIAYALHDANADNLREIDTFLGESTAHSLSQLAATHARWQGNPLFNTIATDASGQVRFDANSVVPRVSDELAARCIAPADQPLFAAEGLAIIDASSSGCRLGSDPDAVEPGIFGPSRLPSLTRTDWVANSNDSPWLTNPAAPLSYPRIVGDTGTERNPRTRFGATTVRDTLSRGDRIDQAALASMVYGDTVHTASLARTDAVAVCQAHPTTSVDGRTVDLRAACATLRDWDGTAAAESRGAVLWDAVWARLAALPDGGWAVPFTKTDALDTPRGLRRDDVSVLNAIAEGVADVAALGLPPDVPTGAVQQFTAPGEDIAIGGCPGQVGCYNAVYTGAELGVGDPTSVLLGSSYLFVATVTQHGTLARTVLSYSQSTDPTSAHFADQTALFARGGLIADEAR